MANLTTLAGTDVHVGDLLRLHVKVKEGDKERIQIFEGMLIAIRGDGIENQTFTVRKIAAGNIGVERIFPSNYPALAKVEIKKLGSVRRSKLYYVRQKSSKQVSQITNIHAQ
jgi:large subunit ribosomal protein L19